MLKSKEDNKVATWAEEVARKLKSQEALRAVENNRFTEEQRLRRHLAPRRWMELKEVIKSRCKELNLEATREILMFEVRPSSSAVVRRLDKAAVLVVEFDEDAFRVFWQCGNESGEYLFRVNVDTTVDLATASGIPYTPAQVAETLIDKLFQR
jgi:hypothetical protein